MLSKGTFALYYGGPEIVEKLNDKPSSITRLVDIWKSSTYIFSAHFLYSFLLSFNCYSSFSNGEKRKKWTSLKRTLVLISTIYIIL